MKFTILYLLCFVGAWAPLSAQDIRQNFGNPPKSSRPMVRWWWPGGDVTDAELRREIDLMDHANFGGAEIQPFQVGLNSRMPEATRNRVEDYLTPDFFRHVSAALGEARSHGMWLDYTFGSGWPFGGANVITPELATVELASTHQTIRGPVHFHQTIQMPQLSSNLTGDTKLPPGWLERFRQREKLVAVVAIRGEMVHFYPSQQPYEPPSVKSTGQLDPGSAIVLTDHVSPNGTLDWNVPEGTWQVFAFKEMPTGERVAGGAGVGPQLVLDHMNRRAFDIYANRVGGTTRRYESQFFGHGLRATFCDSLEVRAELYWNDNFLQEFRKLRGYDLTPFLPILQVPGFGVPSGGTAANLSLYDIQGIGDRVRRDYWQTVSDVMFDNFYLPFDQWAANNNLLSRVQAHGSPTDLLRVYGAATIPETEDLYDNGRYDFLKMSSSAADLYGRKIVSSESFVWEGKAYQVTPERIKRFADELLTAGINEIIYHGFPYTYPDRPFPGWHPFAKFGGYSSDMNQTNPFWPYLASLNEYITRVQYLSQAGKTVVPVALYRGGLAYEGIEPPPPEPEINTRLMAAGYNFDHIDAYVLLQCHVVDGKLVSPGEEKYSVLILPKQKTVTSEVAHQLIAFARQGLQIVFVGPIPVTEPEVVNGQIRSGPVTRPLQAILKSGNVHTAADSTNAVSALNTTAVQPNLRFLGTSVPFIEKRIGTLDAFFLRNSSDTPKAVVADFTAVGTPELWDPWTGKIRPITDFTKHGKTIRLQIHMNGYGSKLLVFNPTAKPGAKPAQTSPPQVLAQETVGKNGWRFHGVGIGPGSEPETIDMDLPNLIDWTMNSRLKHFSGRGEYTTTFTVSTDFFNKHQSVVLDLGDVKDVADISINGKAGPILLLRPYKADVTGLVHVGENTLHIAVVNTLYNALSARGPSANYDLEATNTPNGLMPSGLIGPVRLVINLWSSTTSSLTQFAPAFLRSVFNDGHEVNVLPRTTSASMSIQGP